MKFAITTKLGRSYTIEAANWNEAQKQAIRKFGMGTIVQQISKNNSIENRVYNTTI